MLRSRLSFRWSARQCIALVSVFAALAIAPAGFGQSAKELEALSNAPAVLSPRAEAEVFNATTGAYVFDADAIASLPADSLPEMLRYAPGVHIVRPSNGIWGLGIRGINSRFFNRVLFTVDEQNVYASIFAGLFGSQHDLLLADVASVEVTYGPGGGTWDNNAVNGQVNVRMKTAFETEGSLLQAQLGTESRGLAARVGWSIDDETSARVFMKLGQRDSGPTRFPFENDWDTGRVGLRLDHRTSNRDLVSFSSEAYSSKLGYGYNLANFETGTLTFDAVDEELDGANAQLKWTRNNADGSGASLRSWVAYSDLEAAYASFGIFSLGIEGRSETKFGNRHSLSLNLGAAYDEEDTASTAASDFSDPKLSDYVLYSGFQHNWTLVPEKLSLSWGIDYRFSDRSDSAEASPNASLLYHLGDQSRVWISYSRAKRKPPLSLSVIQSLRSGRALDAPITLPTPSGAIRIEHSLTDAQSLTPLQSEVLDAFEIGYRLQSADEKYDFSINAYAYDYDQIIARVGVSNQLVLTTPTPYVGIHGAYDNVLEGEAYGFEASLGLQFLPGQTARFNYAYAEDSFDPIFAGANDFENAAIEFSRREFDDSSPQHIVSVHLTSQLAPNWQLDNGLRYTSSYDFPKGRQDSIFQLDSRLTWQKSETLRFSLVGRNLLKPSTQEVRLKDFFGHWTETNREVYLEAALNF